MRTETTGGDADLSASKWRVVILGADLFLCGIFTGVAACKYGLGHAISDWIGSILVCFICFVIGIFFCDSDVTCESRASVASEDPPAYPILEIGLRYQTETEQDGQIDSSQ